MEILRSMVRSPLGRRCGPYTNPTADVDSADLHSAIMSGSILTSTQFWTRFNRGGSENLRVSNSQGREFPARFIFCLLALSGPAVGSAGSPDAFTTQCSCHRLIILLARPLWRGLSNCRHLPLASACSCDSKELQAAACCGF